MSRFKALIFLSCLCITLPVFANEVDSLRRKILYSSGIEKVNLVNSLIPNFYIDDKSDSCQKYAETALVVSKGIKYFNGEIDAFNRMALVYSFYNKQKCLENAQKALKMSQKTEYQKGEAEANYFLGTYYLAHDPFMALGYFA